MASPNVLSVEDDNGMSLLLKMAFEESCPNIKLHRAADAKQALKLLRETDSFPCPEVILIDIQLPGMDGFELLKELKSDSRFCNIPVVMLTTSAYEQQRKRALELGATNCCRKGNSFEEILTTVEDICKLADAQVA